MNSHAENIAIFLQTPQLRSLTMSDRQATRLAALLPHCKVVHCHSEPEFVQALPEAAIALTWIFRQEWFALAPQLRLVSTPAAGKDYFSVEWPAGIEHWNGAFHGRIMAESAVGMILGMCRGILPACTTFRNIAWPRPQIDAICGTLYGSTVAICGFGRIGRAIGERLKPFGVRMFGISAHHGHTPPEYFTDGDILATGEELPRLLPLVDHLVLVMPRTAQTDGFLSRRRLAMLKRGATVCNLGRGNAIDEQALCEALQSGHLAGACLDVAATEPLDDASPLRHCPNLWITPHSSAFTAQYMDFYIDELVGRLSSYFLKA